MAPVSLPPGFRFHPTDEELVGYYLHGKIEGRKTNLEMIPETDLYDCEPWELPEKSPLWKSTLDAIAGYLLDDDDEEKWWLLKNHKEWYFFSRREKKYPNGSRTKRATKLGYWNGSGKERQVWSQGKAVGTKRTLVYYYKCGVPKPIRTNWVMHEYSLLQSLSGSTPSLKDSYSLCRVFMKPIPNGPKSKEEIANIAINTETAHIDEDLQGDYVSNSKPSRGTDYGSSCLIQDIQMENNCFNFLPSAMEDFTHIGAAETTMPETTYHQDAVEITGCDKFKEYKNGRVMLEDIDDLWPTEGNIQ